MFFSTESSLTFKTMAQVIQEYPNWHFKIRSGYEMIFKEKADAGIADFIEFWNRLQISPDETIYDTIENGVKEIQNRTTVIHVSDKSLRQYLKQRF